jgi:uncharacterized protein (TIGR02231 family)
MLRLAPVALMLALVCAALRAAEAPPPDDDKAKTVTSAITEVTVYADRARVTRTATVDVPAGATRVAFRKLPGWVDDASVRVALTPPEAGQILDVEVKRTYLARPAEDEFRKAETDVRAISDQVAALDDEAKVLDAQAKQVEAMRAFSLEKLPKDVAVREIKTAEYGQVVDFVAESLRKIAKGRRELEVKKRDLQPELSARQRKLNELHQRAQLEQRTVYVDVKGAAARNATLTLTYMLPGATWEPAHELRAGAANKSVALNSYAVVSQTTGEDWTGAALILSTQSTSATLRIPELEAMLVGSGRSLARAVRATENDSFEEANKVFAGQNVMLFNLDNEEATIQLGYQLNQARQEVVQKKVQESFRVLQQRGTTAHFAAGVQTVRADGRPVRVGIGTTTLEAQSKIVAAPEVSLNAAQAVDLVNTGKQPLLPGKVAIYMEGAFLGSTEVDFVAQGEAFGLFLGVADAVKLARTLDKKQSAFVSDGKRTRLQAAYRVTVENLSDKAVTLQLSDRVPVAETEEVRVRNIRILPETRPDEKGLLRWDVTLAPKQSREFHIEYTLDYPSDLPRRAAEEKADAKTGVPAPAQPSLKMQIQHLEKQLH